MAIKWRSPPEVLLDTFELNRVNEVAAMFRMQDCTAIDSYEMSPDGPILTSVFLLNDEFIAEVRVDTKELNCDVSPIKSACNLRLKKVSTPSRSREEANISSTDSNPETASATAKDIVFAQVKISHYNDLSSIMGFFGDEVNEWLDFVLSTHLSKRIWV